MHKIRNVDFSISLDLDMTKHTNSVQDPAGAESRSEGWEDL